MPSPNVGASDLLSASLGDASGIDQATIDYFRSGAGQSIVDALFGRSPRTSTSTRSLLTPEQEAALRRLISGLGADIDNIPQFGGQPTDLERLSLSALEQQAMDSVTGQSELRRTATEALIGQITGQPDDFNEYFRESIQNPALRSFEEEVLPGIGRRFTGANFFGSERARADDYARGRLIDSLAGERARLGFQSRESAKNRSLSALGIVPEYENAPIRNLTSLLEAGQGVSDRSYQRFLDQEEIRRGRIQELLNALNVRGRENIVRSTPGTTGLVSSFLQGGGGQAIGAAFASDRRLKSDIMRIGTMPSGLNIYSYTIFGKPEIGVMADEVRKMFPNAVTTGPDGYDLVDYSQIG